MNFILLIWIMNFIYKMVSSVNSIPEISSTREVNDLCDKSSSEKFSHNGVWSNLLEEYIFCKTPMSVRSIENRRSMMGFSLWRGFGDNVELDPRKVDQSGNIANRKYSPSSDFGYAQQFREVSETDLYLLGAIEKLVYRMEDMEHRLQRSEQLISYLMAGKENEALRSCPSDFTKVGDNCYRIFNTTKLNWKSAKNLCDTYNSYLVEFNDPTEKTNIIEYLKTNPIYWGKSFWLGGLNPGLLWIWSNSAKPINSDINSSSISTILSKISVNTNTSNHKVDEIEGNGRCLSLKYNSTNSIYKYAGIECMAVQNFICEFIDNKLQEKIENLARNVFL